jgi:hypothetical protein
MPIYRIVAVSNSGTIMPIYTQIFTTQPFFLPSLRITWAADVTVQNDACRETGLLGLWRHACDADSASVGGDIERTVVGTALQ